MTSAAVIAPETGDVSSWDLIAAAQGGDRGAFGELYSRYVGTVFRFAVGRVGPVLADDIVSETFCRALRSVSSVTYQGSDVGAWFITIARNLIHDYRKSGCGRTEPKTPDMEELLPASPGVDEEVIARESTEEATVRVRAAIARLPLDYRTCIQLRYLQGFTVEETAAVMGRPTGTVKAWTSRAFHSLRQFISGRVA